MCRALRVGTSLSESRDGGEETLPTLCRTFWRPSSCPPRSASIISTSRFAGLWIGSFCTQETETPAVLPSSLRALITLTDTGSSFSNLCGQWEEEATADAKAKSKRRLGRATLCSQHQAGEATRVKQILWCSGLQIPPAAHCKLVFITEPSCCYDAFLREDAAHHLQTTAHLTSAMFVGQLHELRLRNRSTVEDRPSNVQETMAGARSAANLSEQV